MNNDKIKAVADIIENIHWELIRYGRMDKDKGRFAIFRGRTFYDYKQHFE